MIITGVTLRDYGAYAGTHDFDLAPTDGRPVVLVGGVNGAGKTTLFESVMLCLYGADATGRATRKAYLRELAARMHRGPGGRAACSSVAVRFRFFHGGAEYEYLVERSWTAGGGEVEEELSVSKGEPGGPAGPLDTVERAHWQSFIGDLVPRGIAGLFFFDGEKITDMARGGTEDEVIRESFSALLGLDLVEQLRADLQVSVARRAGGRSAPLQREMERLRTEKEKEKESVRRLSEALAAKRSEAGQVRRRVEAAESRITRIGGGFADRRADTMQELASKKASLESARTSLAELCAGILPLSMVPRLLDELVSRLHKDDESRRVESGRRMVAEKMAEIRERAGVRFWEEAGVADAGAASKALESLLGVQDGPPGVPAFGLSAEQSAWVAGAAEQAGQALGQLESLAGQASDLAEQVAALERSVASAPRDDETGRLVSEAGRLRAQEGQLAAEIEHIEQRIAAGLAMARHAEEGLRRAGSQARTAAGSRAGARLAAGVLDVLAEFSDQLRARKVGVLEEHLMDALSVLLHKRGLVGGVRVDPGTFEVTLYAEGGGMLPRESLSTGEKQMLATAVLWALARTSGRPLPFMIDTPLARLDSAHRDNIVDRFLPSAAHQVVVFSTDTEIDERYHERLEPRIARSYAMEHDPESGSTRVREGYFWGGKVAA